MTRAHRETSQKTTSAVAKFRNSIYLLLSPSSKTALNYSINYKVNSPYLSLVNDGGGSVGYRDIRINMCILL